MEGLVRQPTDHHQSSLFAGPLPNFLPSAISLAAFLSGAMGRELKILSLQVPREWAIQILVLLSFWSQVILVLFAGIRRRNGSLKLAVALWFAYQLAERTATYALGHLSTGISSHEHALFAFWAPFLLLHLGGQDNVTAYSLEDNMIWQRHLLTLVMQLAGAGYVIYKSTAITDSRLATASVLLFVSAVLKNWERIWSLRRANIGIIRRSVQEQESDAHHSAGTMAVDLNEEFPLGPAGSKRRRQDNVVLGAQAMFKISKRLFLDLTVGGGWWSSWDLRDLITARAEHVYPVIEAEISLMYDILYTKAAVIHTWYGCCIRAVSLLSAVASLLLFHASSGDGAGYSSVDVTITYVLLFGACALELFSTFRALTSTWTCALLDTWRRRRLLRAVLFLRRVVREEGEQRWSNSVGQYNLIRFCNRARYGLLASTASLLGLGELWNRSQYSGSADASPALKRLILEELVSKAQACDEDGGERDFTSRRGKWALRQRDLDSVLGWSVDVDFDESILAWHIATDIILHFCDAERGDESETAKAVKVLSDYMMFLLAAHPYVLPGPPHRSRFDNACDDMAELCSMIPKVQVPSRAAAVSAPQEMLLLMLGRINDADPSQGSRSALVRGARLAKALLDRVQSGMLERLQVIEAVWVEMLCYAACNCAGSFHARQLSCGGELLTVVRFLMAHVGVDGSELEDPITAHENLISKIQLDEQDFERYSQQMEALRLPAAGKRSAGGTAWFVNIYSGGVHGGE